MVLAIHIAAGGLAIVLGAVALLVRKGSWLHRRAGLVFVLAMLSMGISGSVLAARHSLTNVNVLGGLVCAYFVTTALITVRADPVWMRRLTIGAFFAAIGLVLIEVRVGLSAFTGELGISDGVPLRGLPLFWMAAITAFAAAGDVRVLRSAAPGGRRRIARHLWRMCFALFIATGSFFSIPERVRTLLPEPFAAPPLQLLPILLPVVAMLYWLWRVRRSTGWRAARQDETVLSRVESASLR